MRTERRRSLVAFTPLALPTTAVAVVLLLLAAIESAFCFLVPSSSSPSTLAPPVAGTRHDLPSSSSFVPLSAFRGPKKRSSSSSDRRRRGGGDDDSYGDFDYGFGDDDTYGYTEEELGEEFPRRSSSSSTSGTVGTTTSADYALDPTSPQAESLIASLGLSSTQHAKLAELADLVVEWNDRINLVSRKDCTREVVFGRHVLPSVALCGVPDFPLGRPDEESSATDARKKRAVDVGTGGGFPGLPLAISYPHVAFTLVDSVGKKLTAVQAMADELGLTNVRTYHGRAEEMTDTAEGASEHGGAYDLCLGRSVTGMPRFCFWVQDLLRRRRQDKDEEVEEEEVEGEGALVYIIGGDVEPSVTSRVLHDVPLCSLLGDDPRTSDKRALVLRASDVIDVAAESGEVRKKPQPGSGKKKKGRSNPRRQRREAKGHWKGRSSGDDDDDAPKQRGYENFKRYQS